MPEESELSRWIDAIRNQYPELPNQLTREVENDLLEKLSGWKERVAQLRKKYDRGELTPEDLPPQFRGVGGGRQVIPTLASIETMTDEEQEAWHKLFSCVAAQMGEYTQRYWDTHNRSSESSLTLTDALNYLPIVFLYVLASYDAGRSGGEYSGEDDFRVDEGRTRLTTWTYKQSRYHINTYLQKHAYIISQGAGYMHRLRYQVEDIRDRKYVEDGARPSHEEIVDEISNETYYGQSVSRETVGRHVSQIQQPYSVVSTESPVGGSDDEDYTYGDQIPSDEPERDPKATGAYAYVDQRLDEGALKSACLKILSGTEELTVDEAFAF